MSLLAPWLLLGGILAGVPLLLHLLNKSKFKVESWGAMMFLHSAAKAKAQRIKIQQWLLLLLRILFFLLLAFALARPIIKRTEMASSDQPITHLIVLDASYSMQRQGKQGDLFAKAKQRILEIVQHMKRGDNMGIVWASHRPQLLFDGLSYDREFLQHKVESLEAGESEANLPKALEKAFFVLEESTLPVHRIYVISDEQAQNWHLEKKGFWQHLKDHYQFKKVKPGLAYLNVYENENQENARILDIVSESPIIDTHRSTRFWVDIDYTGKKDLTTTLNFFVDGKLKAQRDLNLKEGKQRIDFEHRFTEAGDHRIHARLGKDNLDIDNHYHKAIRVRESLPILLVDAEGERGSFQTGGKLMQLALQSAVDIDETSLMNVTLKPYYELDQMTLETLKPFRAIVLCNVTSLSQYTKFMLEQYLAGGGGLMITMGENTRVEDYNKLYRGDKGLLPAKLVVKKSPAEKDVNPRVESSRKHPILELFSKDEGRVLGGVKVKDFFKLEPSKQAIPLIYLGQDPIAVYQKFRKGRVLLYSTDVSGQWNNLPFTRDFLPLAQNLVLYLAANVAPPIHLSQGEPLITSWDEVPENSDKNVELTLPNGEIEKLPLHFERGTWVTHYERTEQAGLYKLKLGDKVKAMSVHLPMQEGILHAIENAKFAEVKDFLDFQSLSMQGDFVHNLSAGMEHIEIWKYLLIAAILILCLEGLLSWRFSR